MTDTTQPQQPQQQDPSRVLQDLFGVTAMIQQFRAALTSPEVRAVFTSEEVQTMLTNAVTNGAKGVFDDQDYINILASVCADTMARVLRREVEAQEYETQESGEESTQEAYLVQVGSMILSHDLVKNALVDCVYQGMKRMVTDGEAQQGIAQVAKLIFSSQEASNMVSRAVDLAARRQTEFIMSEEFAGIFKKIADDAVARSQDVINLTMSEFAENMKKVELSGKFSLT